MHRIKSAQDDDDGDDGDGDDDDNESVEQLPTRDIGVNTDGDQETARQKTWK